MAIGTIKPELIAIRQLFKEEAQTLRIPTIQRQWVWEAEDVKELIDSIINGYPIGAVIIWEPQSEFPSAPLTDEVIKIPRKTRYVLDGQQRLTALMLMQHGWRTTRASKSVKTTPISYIPESQKLYLSSRKGIDVSLVVNATLGDADSLTRLQRDFPRTCKQVIDGIGERIVNYQLPFYILRTDETAGSNVYEQIADIFTRVNSAGVKIGNLEMFLSFFAAAFPRKQKDKIIAMHERFSDQFGLDLEPLVRFVFSRMGMSQNQITKVASFQRAIHQLRERFAKRQVEISRILERCESSVAMTLEFLEKELGLSSTDYIPSQNVLLPLFDFAYEHKYEGLENIPSNDKKRMLRWFITGSFNGVYSQSPNRKIEGDLALVRNSSKSFPSDELFEAMGEWAEYGNNIRKDDVVKYSYTNVLRGRVGKEYLMMLLVLLHANHATNWAGKPVVGEQEAVHHIFPREFLKEKDENRDDYVKCLANLTFIDPSVNSEIGDTPPDEYVSEFTSEEVRRDHFIPQNDKLWKVERYEDFLDARAKLIWAAIRQLTGRLEG